MVRVLFVLLIGLAASARADVPVTSYECSPGTPGQGACNCPKNHSAQRDPADEGKAICVAGAAKSISQLQPTVGGYAQLLREANEAADAFDCAKAEELYSKALKINAKGVEALVGSGVCMAKQSKWSNAHAQYDKAIAINAKFEPALWNKAEAYRLASNNDAAIAAYRAYLTAFPGAAKAKQALTKLGASAPAKVIKNPKRTQDVVIGITGTAITANGVPVTGNGMVADWIAIYGKPDRTWTNSAKINKIHTWDKLGFIIYEPYGNPGRATSVTFLFKPMKMEYDPKTMFAGSIVVDGGDLTAQTELNKVKSRTGATLPYGANSVVFPKGAFNVFTTGKNGPLELVELAMWKTEKPGADVASSTGVTAEKVLVEVTKTGSVKVQGKEIGKTPTVADFKKIYGEPDRVWDKAGAANKIYVWDSLGVLVYEPSGTGKAKTLSMPWKAMGSDYSPKTLFKGRITVDGRGIYNFNTITTLSKREGASQPYGTDSVMFDYGDIHVFTSVKSETDATNSGVEVSFQNK